MYAYCIRFEIPPKLETFRCIIISLNEKSLPNVLLFGHSSYTYTKYILKKQIEYKIEIYFFESFTNYQYPQVYISFLLPLCW